MNSVPRTPHIVNVKPVRPPVKPARPICQTSPAGPVISRRHIPALNFAKHITLELEGWPPRRYYAMRSICFVLSLLRTTTKKGGEAETSPPAGVSRLEGRSLM